MFNKLSEILIIFLAFFSSVSHAEVYKWTDTNGNIHFSDVKPASIKAEELSLEINTYTQVSFERSSYNAGSKVIMYSTKSCGYCKKAKKYFKNNNIAFTDYDINKDAKARRRHKEMGATGVPVILVGDKRLNGFSESSFQRIYKNR